MIWNFGEWVINIFANVSSQRFYELSKLFYYLKNSLLEHLGPKFLTLLGMDESFRLVRKFTSLNCLIFQQVKII